MVSVSCRAMETTKNFSIILSIFEPCKKSEDKNYSKINKFTF